MKKLILKQPVVSVRFLQENIDADEKDFKIPQTGIIGARYISWKKDFTDSSSSIPNMLPNAEHFTSAAQVMGINKDSAIVVYDNKGIYSSPRIYWMFKTMGHNNIAILDGGFPHWQKGDGEISKLDFGLFEKGDFQANLKIDLIKSKEEVFNALNNDSCAILDARSKGRFEGTSPEPRASLRSGHIPGSMSLPFKEVLNDGKFKEKEELRSIINVLLGEDKEEITFSCGSGITASILFLAAEHCGFKNVSVYDGSWSEWGMPSGLPIN
jgi:thiosulfate/3-mercaptopyruvate sulfurtransferase